MNRPKEVEEFMRAFSMQNIDDARQYILSLESRLKEAEELIRDFEIDIPEILVFTELRGFDLRKEWAGRISAYRKQSQKERNGGTI
jgi:glutaredoxin 2